MRRRATELCHRYADQYTGAFGSVTTTRPSAGIEEVPGGEARLLFRLLGELKVDLPGSGARLTGSRQRKLLTLLLLNLDRSVSVDRIVDSLWEVPPRSYRQQVHNAVGSLRRAFAAVPEVELLTSEVGYRLRADRACVDIYRFHTEVGKSQELESHGDLDQAAKVLKSALDLWRGPALESLDGRYLEAMARELDEHRLLARERFISLQLRLGAARTVVGDLMKLVAEYPLRESLRENLMLALHQSGQRADALAVFEETRRRLADELGLDPGARLQDLHTRILRGQASVEETTGRTRKPGVGATAGPEAVPARALPRTTSEFTGREAELSALLSSVHDSSSATLPILVIDGIGGVGKTTLALRLAHQLTEEFPDGQYFLDLHGFSDSHEPVPPAAALEDLLRESGVPPQSVPSSLEARARLWRSRLSGKRVIVVLDNVKDEAQIRSLIPGAPDTCVLVTCRRKLAALEGSTPLFLDVLPHRDGVGMFRQIAGPGRVGDDRDGVAEIVELCGRLPLAIRVAAARFRDRRSWTTRDLIGQLGSRERRTSFLAAGDRDVFAVLRLSQRYLSERDTDVLRLLAFHSSPVDASTVAERCYLSIEDAERCLSTLFEHNLLVQRTSQRYELLDILRDCTHCPYPTEPGPIPEHPILTRHSARGRRTDRGW